MGSPPHCHSLLLSGTCAQPAQNPCRVSRNDNAQNDDVDDGRRRYQHPPRHGGRIRTRRPWMLTMGVLAAAAASLRPCSALQPHRRPHIKPMRNGKTSLDYVSARGSVGGKLSTVATPPPSRPTLVTEHVSEFLLVESIPLSLNGGAKKTTKAINNDHNNDHKYSTTAVTTTAATSNVALQQHNKQHFKPLRSPSASSRLPSRSRRVTAVTTSFNARAARAESAHQLKAAEKAALLTREEEIALANQIRALRQAEQIRDEQLLAAAARDNSQNNNDSDRKTPAGGTPSMMIPPIPHLTESQWANFCGMSVAKLHRIVEQGQEARSHLALSNVGLVAAIAKRHYLSLKQALRGSVGTILSLQDIMQEGQLGLMEAAERFDPERGVRFSTYATWWIRQRILRSISDSSRIIRLPAHVHSMLTKINKAKMEMKRVTGREPSTQDLAHYLEIPEEKLHQYYESSRNVVSLENPLRTNGNLMKADDTRTIADTIASDAPTPLEDAQQVSLQQELRRVMEDSLAQLERQVLVTRYGLDDGHPKSMEETSRVLGLSRERVRLLEVRALNKLRHPQRNYRLKTYMGADSAHEDSSRIALDQYPTKATTVKAPKNPYTVRDNRKQRTTNPFKSSSSPSSSPFTGFSSSGGGNFHDDYEADATSRPSRKHAKDENKALSGQLWFF